MLAPSLPALKNIKIYLHKRDNEYEERWFPTALHNSYHYMREHKEYTICRQGSMALPFDDIIIDYFSS